MIKIKNACINKDRVRLQNNLVNHQLKREPIFRCRHQVFSALSLFAFFANVK